MFLKVCKKVSMSKYVVSKYQIEFTTTKLEAWRFLGKFQAGLPVIHFCQLSPLHRPVDRWIVDTPGFRWPQRQVSKMLKQFYFLTLKKETETAAHRTYQTICSWIFVNEKVTSEKYTLEIQHYSKYNSYAILYSELIITNVIIVLSFWLWLI